MTGDKQKPCPGGHSPDQGEIRSVIGSAYNCGSIDRLSLWTEPHARGKSTLTVPRGAIDPVIGSAYHRRPINQKKRFPLSSAVWHFEEGGGDTRAKVLTK